MLKLFEFWSRKRRRRKGGGKVRLSDAGKYGKITKDFSLSKTIQVKFEVLKF